VRSAIWCRTGLARSTTSIFGSDWIKNLDHTAEAMCDPQLRSWALGSCRSTIELHPQWGAFYRNTIKKKKAPFGALEEMLLVLESVQHTRTVGGASRITRNNCGGSNFLRNIVRKATTEGNLVQIAEVASVLGITNL